MIRTIMLILGVLFAALGAGLLVMLRLAQVGEFLLLFTPLPQITGVLMLMAGAVALGAWAVMGRDVRDIETRDEMNRQ